MLPSVGTTAATLQASAKTMLSSGTAVHSLSSSLASIYPSIKSFSVSQVGTTTWTPSSAPAYTIKPQTEAASSASAALATVAVSCVGAVLIGALAL